MGLFIESTSVSASRESALPHLVSKIESLYENKDYDLGHLFDTEKVVIRQIKSRRKEVSIMDCEDW